MDSETSDSSNDRAQISTRKRNTGKVPRKIHKAAREKLKRSHMNELFLDLGKALGAGDVDHHNNGKASVLRETVRLLGELVSQIDSLKRENTTLLSEHNYITSERNELLEETSALDTQIKNLLCEIDERANCSNQSRSSAIQLSEEHVAVPLISHASETAPIAAPMFVVPLHHESPGFPISFPDMSAPSEVSRPRPRYPSSSDSWPSHILTK